MFEMVVAKAQIRKVLTFMIIFLIAAAVVSIPILASGFNIFEVYAIFLYGGFGSIETFARTLMRTSPVLFTSLGVIIAYRAGLWNIGAEGQLYMGALGAVMAGLFLRNIPMPLHVLIVFLSSSVFGGIWGGLAGFLKVRYRANEIIVTLLLNFIAIWIVYYVVRFPLKGVHQVNPVTGPIAETARLPIIFPGTTLHAGILIGLVLAFVLWLVLGRTVFGYRNKAIGSNLEAARYGGVHINKMIMVSMILSGGVAGLAGMSEVSGVHYHLADNISLNYGYLAIPIALLGRLNPLGAILGSIAIGGLLNGARFAQVAIGIPSTIVYMMMAVFIIALVLEDYLDSLLSSIIKD